MSSSPVVDKPAESSSPSKKEAQTEEKDGQSEGGDGKFNEFYSQVKEIEKRDSTLTPKDQINRLNRAGSSYFNLNPFDVLQVDPDTPLNEIKQKYRRMSILVHPDKNQDDVERAQKAFDALNKAWKTLEHEEGYKRCQEIVTEARVKTDEMMELKRKQNKKEGKPKVIAEDNPEQYKHAVYVQTCKLFADLERWRKEQEMRDQNDRKRKAADEAAEAERLEEEKEYQKNYEESRDGRVNSWRNFKSNKKSKGFKLPKTKVHKPS